MTSLSISSKIFFSMYTTKLSFIYLSPILFRNLLLSICMAEKTLSTVAVAIDKSNDNLISIYTNVNNKFFVFIIFSVRLTIPSISENSSSLHRSTKLVTKYHKVHYREFIGIKKKEANKLFFVESREKVIWV